MDEPLLNAIFFSNLSQCHCSKIDWFYHLAHSQRWKFKYWESKNAQSKVQLWKNKLTNKQIRVLIIPPHPHYLWCLCRTEHELTLPCVHLAQSQTAGFSILLQLLLLPLLHILVGCRVTICTGVMTVTVALREETDIVMNKLFSQAE